MVRIRSTHRGIVSSEASVDFEKANGSLTSVNRLPVPSIPDWQLSRARSVRAELLNLWPGEDTKRSRYIALFALNDEPDLGMIGAALGASFTQIGSPTLVIDADFRHPIIHQIFGAPATPGLSNVLREKRRIRDSIHCTALRSLDIMPIGDIQPRDLDLLEGSVLIDLIGDSIQRSTVTIFILGNANTRAISNILRGFDAVIPVLRRADVTVREVTNLVDSLKRQGIPLGAFVMND